ncbi:hypothetical protein MC7420_5008 [Coleofasciculus chthonoplastes PCC 7420]|uniref:Uncharacterized protein n=1 Tax=Coleofasciculus chthonoplastes PCC 7420 TaxID=118168 RepID=B4VZC1_9CYAN|nr:hypothetical protein MC7420_5008 [Coleofasciculus chthonoplastes PCC 7420]
MEIYNNGVELTSSTPALRGTPGSNYYSSWGRSLSSCLYSRRFLSFSFFGESQLSPLPS